MINQFYVTKPIENLVERKRCLNFSGAKNFRDLGGYKSANGSTIRWGVLYRSDGLQKLTESDLRLLSTLNLDRIVDFRSHYEKALEPDHLPVDRNFRVAEIPILDSSTRIWHETRDEFIKNIKTIDAEKYMIQTNIELATVFTAEIQLFYNELLSANGRPVLFHCAAGKDRTGFAAATLLKILEVPYEIIMEDYLLTNQYFLPSYKWSFAMMHALKGHQFASAVKGFMEARPIYLLTAFETLTREYGSFENYVQNGLGLSKQDIEQLKLTYLE